MVFDTWGADAMRWFLLSSPVLRGQDLVVHAKGFEEVRAPGPEPHLEHLVLPLPLRQRRRDHGAAPHRRHRASSTATCWPRHRPWSTSVTAQWTPTTSTAPAAASPGSSTPLTNWYIRRSRDRFWRARDGSPEVETRQADAYDTLSTVLATLCRVVAPLLPLLTEDVYQGLTGARSVHLADWPSPTELPADPASGADHGAGA